MLMYFIASITKDSQH